MGVMREMSSCWIVWWAAGLVCGTAFMALFLHLSRLRSLHRICMATSVILLSRLVPEDTRRLFPRHSIPPWVVFSRQEKIDWLDQGVAKIWPFLGKEACISSMITWLESTLELYKTGIFASFKFEEFKLGEIPPQFSGMEKVESKPDEITLEFDFQWIGDPNIVLAVQTMAGSVLPVQIKDVNFAGRFRLTFKPLADKFPCFQAFMYSIRDLKALHFHLRGVPGVIYSHPGFLKMVKRFIKTAIADSLVWPMRQIYKIVPGDYRELELQVSGILRVKVVEARNLLNKDAIGKSDPFTILYIRHIPSRIKRSKTMIHLELCYVCTNEDLLHPLASLTTPRSPLSRQLTSLERHFSTKEAKLSPTIKTLLSPRNFMETVVVRGILSITVLRTDELMIKKTKKLLNAFVLLKMKKSPAVMQTKVIRNTNKPEWNEVFNIVIEDALHDMLLLEVWNHKLLKKSLIGKSAVTVTCLLQHNNNDMEVELHEANAGKVILHLEWRCPAPSDPQFF